MAWKNDGYIAIDHAEMAVASAEHVYARLHDYGEFVRARYYSWDEGLERMLASRGEPLINLGLARFGGCQEVASMLYDTARLGTGDATYDKGIRIAILANPRSLDQSFGAFWIGSNSGELRRLAVDGEYEEMSALLKNESAGKIVERVLSRKEPFHDLPPARLAILVRHCGGNPRFNRDDSNSDGPDMLAMRLRDALLDCIQYAPVDYDWLIALYALLEKIDPTNCPTAGEKLTLDVLQKWKGAYIPAYVGSEKEARGYYTEMTLVEEFRCYFAAKCGRTNVDDHGFTLRPVGGMDHDDVALRASYYRFARLTSDEIKKGYQKDGDAFVFTAMMNNSVFLKPESRKSFEEALSGGWMREYTARCNELKTQYPFFDPTPQTTYMAVEDEDQRAIDYAADLAQIKSEINNIGASVGANTILMLCGFIALTVIFFIWR